MRDTAFVMLDDMRARKAKIHQRVDGNLVPLDLELPQPAEVELGGAGLYGTVRSEEHTSELQSLMRISYDVFCLKKKKNHYYIVHDTHKSTQKETENNTRIQYYIY